MKLVDALRLAAQAPSPSAAGSLKVALVCGFTPLHLQTFLTAHLRQRSPERHVEVTTGLFDDIPGSLKDLRGRPLDAAAIVLEWSDLDPRLGLRQLGGWSPRNLPAIIDHATTWLAQVQALIEELARETPVVVSMPTLPLPPVFFNAGWQAGGHELTLRERVASFAAAVARITRVRVVNEQALAQLSPPADRLNVKATWMSGFPYQTPHAAALGDLLAAAVQSPMPKKALITDLDNTLWSGVVGDDGVMGIGWDLDHQSQAHGLYQQFLRCLSEEGVLVGVASKNDPAVVDEAFARDDLLLPKERVFPFAVSWGSKAHAVSQVLTAWNIGADSVVFVDDNPIELAEVKFAHPGIECVQFPAEPQAVYELLVGLRRLFGKVSVSQEDEIRLASLRSSAIVGLRLEDSDAYSEALLEQAESELTLDFRKDSRDARALELLNKTNQFNLNGRRLTERAWSDLLRAQDTFVLTATYRDRFGLLGKIAVIAGRVEGHSVYVDWWVMSCRAFARRIEHQCLRAIFDRFGAHTIALDYASTPRNGPVRRFLADTLQASPEPGAVLTAAAFDAACPRLFHRVLVKDGIDDERYAHATP